MQVQTEDNGGVTVFLPSGRLDSNNAVAVEAEVVEHLEKGPARVIFDFRDLEYISSAGLRVILLAAKRLRQLGGSMALCNLSEHIREVFEISGFLSILTVRDSREEARKAVTEG